MRDIENGMVCGSQFGRDKSGDDTLCAACNDVIPERQLEDCDLLSPICYSCQQLVAEDK